ncbi:putative nucleoside-diphosphate-sugar epimerase [Microthyrium microscopicum]|uniref:Putative nucleoside-diphosphate-sugar epimerase n=1 Tax=Microthyrium microscopicum TaxID=703497 RepID=A0A6A6UEY4_9PEZI|nr:putative nucleoside-diphosphate-sugar epimerase [Microthyrium microscopicum]
MHLILTGATGLCGSGVLDAMLRRTDISRITILSRRPVAMATDRKDPRVNVVLHSNFEEYDKELLQQLKGAAGCVWALGISQTQVSKEDYVKITKTFTMAAAEAFQAIETENGKPFNFVYVSGLGATLTPGRFTPIFGRVKGETELALAELRKKNPSFHAMSMRPGGIDSTGHDAINPYVPKLRLFEGTVITLLGPALRVALKSSWSPTPLLGQFLVQMAMGERDDIKGAGVEKVGELPIIENSAFRRVLDESQ